MLSANDFSLVSTQDISENTSFVEFQFISELDAASYIFKVGLSIAILAGSFGNTMIVIIQQRLSDSHDQSLSLFFTALAVSDIFSLMINPVFMVIDSYNVDLNILLDIPTKIRGWVVYSTGWVSPWLLVAMTAQRAASIVWPHKVRTFDNKRKSRIYVFVLVSFCVLSNAHILYGHAERDFKLALTVVNSYDFVSDEYRLFFQVVWTRIHFTVSVLVPFALIIVCNGVLIQTVRRSIRESHVHFRAGNAGALKARGKKVSSMTVRLISVSFAFLVLMTPICVLYVLQEIVSDGIGNDVGIAAKLQLAYAVAIFMWYANFAVNFYVYCLTGRKYREECVRVLFCASGKKSTGSSIPLEQKQVQKRELDPAGDLLSVASLSTLLTNVRSSNKSVH